MKIPWKSHEIPLETQHVHQRLDLDASDPTAVCDSAKIADHPQATWRHGEVMGF